MTTTQALPKGTWSPSRLLSMLEEYVNAPTTAIPWADPRQASRAYSLLELTDDLEIWAIHWPRDQGLELHDHGGSSGALWVVDGGLHEHTMGPDGRESSHHIRAGSGVSFGPSHIHDVVNRHTAPATSVHAYAPPMASMTFYRAHGRTLRADRTEYRADPSWAP